MDAGTFRKPVAVCGNDVETIARICQFRADVWRSTLVSSGRSFLGLEIRDAWDSSAWHWIVRDTHDRIIASARLIVMDDLKGIPEFEQYLCLGLSKLQGRVAAPDRVVVDPSHQRQGLAQLLLNAQELTAIAQGAVIAVRQASPSMVRIIVGQGWVVHGPAKPDPSFPGVDFSIAYKPLAEGCKLHRPSRNAA
jgi:GNAT superfamily N-acetyltransferase